MAAKLPNLRLVQAARAAEVLLLVIVAVLHIAGWLGREYLKGLGTPGILLAESLPFASLALLALWIPLGPGSLWLRGAASPLFAWLLYQATWSKGPTDWAVADTLLGHVAGGLFLVAVGLRLCRMRMQFRAAPFDSKASQFSVRGLLIVTTLVAVCIGGLEAAKPRLRPEGDLGIDELIDRITGDVKSDAEIADFAVMASSPELWRPADVRPRQALMSAILVLTSLLATWAVLRPGAVWLRGAGVAICLPAVGLYLGQLTSLDRESTLTMTVWIATIGLIVGLSVVPLRLMGYRVVRPCIAATSGRAESKPIPGLAGASPSQSLPQSAPSEHALVESHS